MSDVLITMRYDIKKSAFAISRFLRAVITFLGMIKARQPRNCRRREEVARKPETHQRQHLLLRMKFFVRSACASDILVRTSSAQLDNFRYSSHYYDTSENRRLLLGKQVPSIAIICWAATRRRPHNKQVNGATDDVLLLPHKHDGLPGTPSSRSKASFGRSEAGGSETPYRRECSSYCDCRSFAPCATTDARM